MIIVIYNRCLHRVNRYDRHITSCNRHLTIIYHHIITIYNHYHYISLYNHYIHYITIIFHYITTISMCLSRVPSLPGQLRALRNTAAVSASEPLRLRPSRGMCGNPSWSGARPWPGRAPMGSRGSCGMDGGVDGYWWWMVFNDGWYWVFLIVY